MSMYMSDGDADGTGTAAQFFLPADVTTDGAGNLYVADTDNHTIRKIVIATGAVTTVAGVAGQDRLSFPVGVRSIGPNTLAVTTAQGVVRIVLS